MNKGVIAFGLAASVAVSYMILLFLPLPYLALVAAFPLIIMGTARSTLSGFAIGFVTAISIYLLYPLRKVLELSSIIGGIVSLPSIIVLLIFPLFYGLIFAFSGMLWSEIGRKFHTGGAV